MIDVEYKTEMNHRRPILTLTEYRVLSGEVGHLLSINHVDPPKTLVNLYRRGLLTSFEKDGYRIGNGAARWIWKVNEAGKRVVGIAMEIAEMKWDV